VNREGKERNHTKLYRPGGEKRGERRKRVAAVWDRKKFKIRVMIFLFSIEHSVEGRKATVTPRKEASKIQVRGRWTRRRGQTLELFPVQKRDLGGRKSPGKGGPEESSNLFVTTTPIKMDDRNPVRALLDRQFSRLKGGLQGGCGKVNGVLAETIKGRKKKDRLGRKTFNPH